MSISKSPNKAHLLSEKLRESDKHVEALKEIEEAIVEYQKTRDYQGFAKALQSRVLIHKHLFLLSGDNIFAALAKNDEPAKAREYLSKAKAIIDRDKKLIIRKRQLKKLISKFQ